MSPREIAPDYFSPDIRAFILALSCHHVRYLVVGGEAVIYHGHARLTGDVDFFYADDPDNKNRLFQGLLEFWQGDVPGLKSAQDLSPGMIIQFGVPPNRIDLLNHIDGVTFAEAWADRIEVPMQWNARLYTIPYISLNMLIRNKAASARPKDQDDLSYLSGRPKNP
jgi:hypothetical protein